MKNWDINLWRWRHRFTLLFTIERWNDGDEWRVYFLVWEINISKKDELED